MKTELKKMLDGDHYDASDATLATTRIDARTLFATGNLCRVIREIL